MDYIGVCSLTFFASAMSFGFRAFWDLIRGASGGSIVRFDSRPQPREGQAYHPEESRRGAITPTLTKENRRQNRGIPMGICPQVYYVGAVVSCPLIGLRSNIQGFNFSLGVKLLCASERSSAQVQNCHNKRDNTSRPSTSTLWNSSEIMMALNRQRVGTAVYSVLCWLQCRPIRAGPSVFDGQ